MQRRFGQALIRQKPADLFNPGVGKQQARTLNRSPVERATKALLKRVDVEMQIEMLELSGSHALAPDRHARRNIAKTRRARALRNCTPLAAGTDIEFALTFADEKQAWRL